MANEKKFFVDINLQGNALKDATIGSNSNMTKAGSFQYNSVDNRLEYYNGATIETVANLKDITGALDFQGGYDAATNTPNLTTPAAGAVKQGYYYVVTVEGTFFGEDLTVGDSLFAKVDDPSALTDWVIVQGNVDLASETTPGITYLASAAQVETGTETGPYAVNPATLQGKIDAQSYTATLLPNGWVGNINDGYFFTFVHNLGEYVTYSNIYGTFAGEFATESYANELTFYSNNTPTENLTVNIVKAGGNI